MILSKFLLFLGHCVEFNVRGGVIQDQRSAPCNQTFPKCDKIYPSSEAFKCRVSKINNILLRNPNISILDILKKFI